MSTASKASERRPGRSAPLAAVWRYHRLSKHALGHYAEGPGYLDWANQPEPFRRFAGAHEVPLPLAADDDTPLFDALVRPGAIRPRPLTRQTLGLFLELSLGITAWKSFQGTKWALRGNPSSGNLHPTEGYLLIPALPGISDRPGVYHYAPREHALEERSRLGADAWSALSGDPPALAFLAGLSSVHWREAWKYGQRAYRYCQHDVGHALGALSFAAAALGWRVWLLSHVSDADISGLLGLERQGDFAQAEPEAPELLAAVLTNPTGSESVPLPHDAVERVRQGAWRGQANRLSQSHVDWSEIPVVARAATKPRTGDSTPLTAAPPLAAAPTPARSDGLSAARLIRRRRSAVALDGQTGLARSNFVAMMAAALPDPARPPWQSVGFPARVQLALFVHRVENLPAGLYMLMRDGDRRSALRAACHRKFAWLDVELASLPLYALALGDFRPAAAQASCLQEIAADGAFSLAMVADFARTLEEEGSWAYRRLFWECGLIGQALYLQAEAAGVRATGIGCYFDDLVHRLLGLGSEEWQSLYHFTVGGALEDDRLTTLPAYAHLGRGCS
ncbi:MAG: SagB/ThcOx family dehydrogenase [Alphaproteobacteria bacterium]